MEQSHGQEDGADPRASRLRYLEPQFETVCRWAEQVVDDEVPHFAELAGLQIELGAWERRVLKGWDAEERECGLLAEVIAYDIKCHALEGIFTHGPMPEPAALPEFLERLVRTVAVGQALAGELQWSINRLIADGRLADAKSQTCFRSQVTKALERLKGRVGAAELEEAESRAAGLVSVRTVPEPSFDTPVLKEEEPQTHTWANYKPGEVDEPPPQAPWLTPGPEQSDRQFGQQSDRQPVAVGGLRSRRIALLSLVLGLLFALYIVVIAPRIAQESGPPQLTRVHFSQIDGIAAVVARPPSLYVTVHFESWQSLTAQQQQDWLVEVGTIAAEADYSGLRVRTPDGVTVGQWLRKTGVKVVKPHAATRQGAGS